MLPLRWAWSWGRVSEGRGGGGGEGGGWVGRASILGRALKSRGGLGGVVAVMMPACC